MAETAFAALQSVLGSLGLVSSPEKDSPSATKKVCLGIHVNTDDLTLRVPDSRLLDLLDELRLWSSPEHFTIKELQSLLGKLSFVPACVRSSRNSLSGLLDAFRIFPSSVYVTNQPVTPEMRQDLAWCPVAALQSHLRFSSGRAHAPLFSVISPTSQRLFPITYRHFVLFFLQPPARLVWFRHIILHTVFAVVVLVLPSSATFLHNSFIGKGIGKAVLI